MAKQFKKPTLAQKKAVEPVVKEAGPATKEVSKEAHSKVAKGPKPDFKQNKVRVAKRQLNQENAFANQKAKDFDDYLRKERLRFPQMLVGVHSTYHVSGQNSFGKICDFDFIVKLKHFPAKNDKPAQEMLIVEEVLHTGEPVFIFHYWLMKNPSKVCFARGKVGDIQAAMLAFLQHNMSEEILSLKAYRNEEHLRQELAATVPDAQNVQQKVADEIDEEALEAA